MAAAAVYQVDEKYEYDAPQYYDFQENSTGSTCSSWFEAQCKAARETEEASTAIEDRQPLGVIENHIEKPIKKKTNIVTSWETEGVKKRKGGASEQPTSKAAKTSGDDLAEPRTRAQHAAAAAVVKAKRRSKTAEPRTLLKVVKMQLKSKGAKSKTKLKAGHMADVLRPLRVMPARSTKKLTMPKDVELHTSKRAQAHASANQVEHTDDQREDATDAGDDCSPYKPLVLRVREFDKTPGRFKRNPEQPQPPKPLTCTEPKEPKLRTSKRSRPPHVKSREELEAEEMANMPVFKASTLNPLILTSSGRLGVPTVDKREPTEQHPFHFVTDDRAEARAARQQQAAEAGPSKPLVQKEQQAGTSRDGDQAVPKKARKSVAYQPTEPRSPALRTKLRVRECKVEEPRFEFHARPVPKFLSVPRLDLSLIHEPPAPTQPAPFKLATEERGAHHRNAMAAKLAAEEQEASRARIPRAQGLPLSTDVPLVPPKPESRPLTIPEPFALASQVRHQQFEEEKRKRLDDEEAAKREAAEFKARPMWRGIPFRLHDTDVMLTVPEEVPLHTNSRAAERELFNKTMEEKRREAELAAQRAAEEARLREEEERKQLRKAAVFKARPMPDLAVALVAKPPPPKPPTKPKSPKLGRNKRRNSFGQ